MADAHARLAAGRTHVYSFGHRSPAPDGRLGATHTGELPFVFDLAGEPWLHGGTGLLGPDPAPEDLASRMHPRLGRRRGDRCPRLARAHAIRPVRHWLDT